MKKIRPCPIKNFGLEVGPGASIWRHWGPAVGPVVSDRWGCGALGAGGGARWAGCGAGGVRLGARQRCPFPLWGAPGRGNDLRAGADLNGGSHERRALAAEKKFGKLKTCF